MCSTRIDANVSRFTNCMGYAAIMIAAGGEAEYWSTQTWVKGILFTTLPLGLVGLNAFGVKVGIVLVGERARPG